MVAIAQAVAMFGRRRHINRLAEPVQRCMLLAGAFSGGGFRLDPSKDSVDDVTLLLDRKPGDGPLNDLPFLGRHDATILMQNSVFPS